ncbi:MAG TPA: DUF938 domain-containing protein [Steroidobacteraceae bacterium]|nr:DUF938 domain-containing protein [Steroidobacteraceae bacterium]
MTIEQQTLSEACERNKHPILRVLTASFASTRSVLEVGSGTGQHALHFSAHLPHLTWQPSEVGENLAGLRARIAQQGPANLREPIELDVRARPWRVAPVDGLFSANTLHIMSWSSVQEFFRGLDTALVEPAVVCIYGPFRYAGRHTSTSNAAFDDFLRARDPHSGIRDFEAVQRLASAAGLVLLADHAMPANNRTLVWGKPAGARQGGWSQGQETGVE